MSQFGQKVVAVIDTTSSFGVTLKTLKENQQAIQNSLALLLDDAPETLDTLQELAAAISDDPAFFSSMATANANLQSNIDALSTAAQNARDALQSLLEGSIALRSTIDVPEFTGHIKSPEYRAAGTGHLKLRAETGNDLNVYLADQETLQITRDPSTGNPKFTAKGGTGEFKFNQKVDLADGFRVEGTEITTDATELNYLDGVTSSVQTQLNTIDSDATAAVAAVQADVDQNEADADAAIAAVQADVDQNETDADAAIAAVQADVDQNETDADAAIAAVQADVDQNETDGDAADAALSARLDTLEADPTTKTYVDTQVTNLVDAAPGALDTLNELAAALDDDANFATTITNSIAAVQTDVDQNEADADAAIAAVQADVDQNESDADAAIALKAPIASPAFTGTTVTQTAGDTDATTHSIIGGFSDLILKTNQGDFDTHQNEGRILWDDAGGGSAGAIKMKQKIGQDMEFYVGGITASEKKMTITTDGVEVPDFSANVVVNKTFPDLELKSNDEKRVLFTDAGGGATGAIKHTNSSIDFYAGGIVASNKEMVIATDGVDVTALKIAGTAVTADASELNQLDGTTLGTAATAATGDFATAAQGAKADSALQSHQDITGKADLAGDTFTGNVSIAKSWPDLQFKSGDEQRVVFSDAGGSANGAIKFASNVMKFFAGGGIASGNQELSVAADAVTVENALVLDGIVTAADDTAAAAAGVPVNGLYRVAGVGLVKCRIS